MKNLVISKSKETINQTVGTFTFTEKKLKDLHSAVMKSLEAAHMMDKDLVLTPSEALVLGTIMFDIEEAGFANT
ncbi:hypothetical protein [Paenibacillus elgii]|uniref:hypothetical protein n=1 Tax=Paenibacillus elgii TaxID=189691 RepID=UPI000248D214|nr:hypothetical protein [Paenibacillus elgii]